MERCCLDCNAPIKGRADKKFCDDQCRSNYNNHLKADDCSFMKQVNQILKKNRDLLKTQSLEGNVKLQQHELAQKGFDFHYHTHTLTTTNGGTYFFCYEYGYLILETHELLLIKRPPDSPYFDG